MPKIATSFTKQMYDLYEIRFPEGWEVAFVNDHVYTKEDLQDCDYMLISASDPVTAEMMDIAPKLKLVHSLGVSFNTVDLEHAKELGILVCNNKGGNKVAVAEQCIGLLLDAFKRISRQDRMIRRDGYRATQKEFLRMKAHELAGHTIGMVGMGAIGGEVLKRLSVWDADLVYSDPIRLPEAVEKQYNVRYVDFEELCRISDAITIHVPVIPSTTGMIDKAHLDMMKDGVVIVNVSRGVCVVDDDMIEALESGKVGYFAADTITLEPAPDDYCLFNMSPEAMDRFIVTAHTAGRTEEAMHRMISWSLQACLDVEAGKLPPNIVNGVTSIRKTE